MKSDERLRQLVRMHRVDPYNEDAHAALLAEASRRGLINKDKLALAAFIKFEPATKVLIHNVRANGDSFLWFDRALKRFEFLPIVEDLHRWGSRPIIMATCGVLQPDVTEKFFGLLQRIINYAYTDSPAEQLRTRQYLNRHLSEFQQKSITSNITADTSTVSLCREILRSAQQRNLGVGKKGGYPGRSILISANAKLDDDTLIKRIQNGILPWALEEYL